MDFAVAHLAAINSPSHQRGWDAINIGTGCGHSVLEVVIPIEKPRPEKYLTFHSLEVRAILPHVMQAVKKPRKFWVGPLKEI